MQNLGQHGSTAAWQHCSTAARQHGSMAAWQHGIATCGGAR